MMKKQAYTMTELLVASAIIVFLFASVLGAFILTKSLYSDSIASYNLQRDVNATLASMVRGIKEPAGGTFGLRSALPPPADTGFVLLPVADPANSEIDFFSTADDIAPRKYFLRDNTVVYESPTLLPKQKVIYAAPANSDITMRFGSASLDQQVVYIYIAVSQQIGDKTATGSAETYVNLRNTPK